MPVTLNPSGTYGPGTVTAPVDGEARSAASVITPFQQLLNMVGFVKARLDGGVLKVRTVATIADLKAVTGQTTGDHAFVKNLGVYEFDAASAVSSNDVTVVTPTAGGGRWLLGGRLLNVANGFAPLDATAKVPSANLRGHVVSSSSFSIAGQSGTVGTSDINVGSPASLSLVAGQVWHFSGDILMSKSSGSSAGQRFSFVLQVTQPDTVVRPVIASTHYSFDDTGNDAKAAALAGRFVATQSGTHSVQAKLRANVAGLGYVFFTSTVEHFVVAAP